MDLISKYGLTWYLYAWELALMLMVFISVFNFWMLHKILKYLEGFDE